MTDMRTTLTIDDDVLSAAKELAVIEKKSVGEVLSSLARQALTPGETKAKRRNGVPLLKVRKGTPRVTSELVQKLREELP
jgi:predicted CopG family antitoxin